KKRMIKKNKNNIMNFNRSEEVYDYNNNGNINRGNRNIYHDISRIRKDNLYNYRENTSYNNSPTNILNNMYNNCVGAKFYRKIEGVECISRMAKEPRLQDEIINLSDSDELEDDEKPFDHQKKEKIYRMKNKHLRTSGKYSLVLRQSILPQHYKEKMEMNSQDIKLWNYINYDNIYNELCIFEFNDINNRKKIYHMNKEAFIYENEKCIPKEVHINNSEGYQLILLDERFDINLYMMDTKEEKLIRKWCTRNIPINKLLKKVENIYLGFNDTSLFFVDTRIERCIQHIFQYNTKTPRIEHASIDNVGRIIVNTSVGELKYYDGTLNKQNKIKKSKNVIHGTDDMVHLTTTHKGLHSIVTCNKRVIIYENYIGNENFFDYVIKKCYRHQQNSTILYIEPYDEFLNDLGDYYFIKSVIYKDDKYLFTFAKNFCVIWNIYEGINQQVPYTIKKIPEIISDISLYDIQDDQRAILLATENSLILTRLI
ncbi:hypothetical protein PGSY75_0016200C, partial [Plasmodium gaboni]